MLQLVAYLIFIGAMLIPYGDNLGDPFGRSAVKEFCKTLVTGDFHEETPDMCVRGNSALHK